MNPLDIPPKLNSLIRQFAGVRPSTEEAFRNVLQELKQNRRYKKGVRAHNSILSLLNSNLEDLPLPTAFFRFSWNINAPYSSEMG
jgi:hypothetical protein